MDITNILQNDTVKTRQVFMRWPRNTFLELTSFEHEMFKRLIVS